MAFQCITIAIADGARLGVDVGRYGRVVAAAQLLQLRDAATPRRRSGACCTRWSEQETGCGEEWKTELIIGLVLQRPKFTILSN